MKRIKLKTKYINNFISKEVRERQVTGFEFNNLLAIHKAPEASCFYAVTHIPTGARLASNCKDITIAKRVASTATKILGGYLEHPERIEVPTPIRCQFLLARQAIETGV